MSGGHFIPSNKVVRLRELAELCEYGDSGHAMAKELHELANYTETLEISDMHMRPRLEHLEKEVERLSWRASRGGKS